METLIVLLVLSVGIVSSIPLPQYDPHYVGNRSVMVHMFEWKYVDIAKECEDFLGPKGYAGVQISPATENVIVNNPPRPWWERYQPISYKFITRSGNEEELADMIKRCNNAGVRVYVDVILNHMSATHDGNEVGTGGSTARADIKSFPAVPYEAKHFHDSCEMDYSVIWRVYNCELDGLHDLDQSQEYVRDKLVDSLNRLVALGVAGFRIDAAKHIKVPELLAILDRVDDLSTEHGFELGLRPFIFQEVIDYGSNEVIHREDLFPIGIVTEFRYTTILKNAFDGGDKIHWLKNWGTDWSLVDPEYGIYFVDNHDTQRTPERGLNYKNPKKYKMGAAFSLAHPFAKILRQMSSFDFNEAADGPPHDENYNTLSPTFNADGSCGNGWICEHRWRQIANMVHFRTVVQGTELVNWWDNGDQQIAFCRGNKGFVAFNNWWDLKQTLQTCLPQGEYCDVISGNLENGKCTGKTVTVDSNGNAYIEIMGLEDDGVLAIHIESRKQS